MIRYRTELTGNSMASCALFSIFVAAYAVYQWDEIRKLRSEIYELRALHRHLPPNQKDHDEEEKEKTKEDETTRDTKAIEKSAEVVVRDDVKSRDGHVDAGQDTTSKSHTLPNKATNTTTATTATTIDTPATPSNTLQTTFIGTVSSVYRLCVGTPRQGMLAPNSRARIDLNRDILSGDCLDSLDKYGHIWVVFVFHCNTNTKVVKKATSTAKNKGKHTKKGGNIMFPSKVSPPALGGKRVGLFSTRTPHRPNPIGLSLCVLEGVQMGNNKKSKKNKKEGGGKQREERCCIYISGIDLVDGTPVLDIKPYVPHYDSVHNNNITTSNNNVRLPPWVSTGLVKRRTVSFTTTSMEQLEVLVQQNHLDFYGQYEEKYYPTLDQQTQHQTYNNNEQHKTRNNALSSIRSCIQEVLSVDVRSAWQTKKARKGNSQADRALRDAKVISTTVSAAPSTTNCADITNENEDTTAAANIVQKDKLCTQQIDNLLIYYSVNESKKEKEVEKEERTYSAAKGSGCDDEVLVHFIDLMVRMPQKKEGGSEKQKQTSIGEIKSLDSSSSSAAVRTTICQKNTINDKDRPERNVSSNTQNEEDVTGVPSEQTKHAAAAESPDISSPIVSLNEDAKKQATSEDATQKETINDVVVVDDDAITKNDYKHDTEVTIVEETLASTQQSLSNTTTATEAAAAATTTISSKPIIVNQEPPSEEEKEKVIMTTGPSKQQPYDSDSVAATQPQAQKEEESTADSVEEHHQKQKQDAIKPNDDENDLPLLLSSANDENTNSETKEQTQIMPQDSNPPTTNDTNEESPSLKQETMDDDVKKDNDDDAAASNPPLLTPQQQLPPPANMEMSFVEVTKEDDDNKEAITKEEEVTTQSPPSSILAKKNEFTKNVTTATTTSDATTTTTTAPIKPPHSFTKSVVKETTTNTQRAMNTKRRSVIPQSSITTESTKHKVEIVAPQRPEEYAYKNLKNMWSRASAVNTPPGGAGGTKLFTPEEEDKRLKDRRRISSVATSGRDNKTDDLKEDSQSTNIVVPKQQHGDNEEDEDSTTGSSGEIISRQGSNSSSDGNASSSDFVMVKDEEEDGNALVDDGDNKEDESANIVSKKDAIVSSGEEEETLVDSSVVITQEKKEKNMMLDDDDANGKQEEGENKMNTGS